MSNDELVEALKAAGRDESALVARVITMLMEVEARQVHLELACSSMFEFCVRRLNMSEGEAYRRIAAARLAKEFPEVLEALRTRRVHLTNVVLLRDLFTRANVNELLRQTAGKTKREVEQLVATLAPKPDVRALIRKLPEGKPAATRTPSASLPMPTPTPTPTPMLTPTRAVAEPRAQLAPLSETRHRVQFTASNALRKKLERAQSLMRHRNVDGDLAVVVERAMDLLIAELEKQKLAATERPKAPASQAVKGVSASARREVVQRDQEQCAFVSSDGERCASRDFLEIDHRHPRAFGGTNEVANLRLLCRAHNRLAAEQVFGREYVARAIRFRQRQRQRKKPLTADQPYLPMT